MKMKQTICLIIGILIILVSLTSAEIGDLFIDDPILCEEVDSISCVDNFYNLTDNNTMNKNWKDEKILKKLDKGKFKYKKFMK